MSVNDPGQGKVAGRLATITGKVGRNAGTALGGEGASNNCMRNRDNQKRRLRQNF
jgi:hypothetical protein